MTDAQIKRTNRRMLARHGKDVTHRTYSETGTDGYGDPEHSESTSTVTARVHRPSSPTEVRNASGDEIQADVEVIVADSVSVTDVDSGDGRPDEFVADATEYRVLRVDDQDNGLLVCQCVRK